MLNTNQTTAADKAAEKEMLFCHPNHDDCIKCDKARKAIIVARRKKFAKARAKH